MFSIYIFFDIVMVEIKKSDQQRSQNNSFGIKGSRVVWYTV